MNAQCIILPLTSSAPEKQGNCTRSCMASYGSSYIIDLHLAVKFWKSLLNKPCHSLGIIHTCRLRYIALTGIIKPILCILLHALYYLLNNLLFTSYL